MPSVDTIRNIKIQGSSNGVDEATAALNKLTASIAAANDNLSKTRAAANENSEGFRLTGEGALTAANHMRQAAEAAYIFSPAFRSVVNEMAAPALKAAHVSLEAVATGMVLATNAAGTGLVKLSGAAASVSPAFAPLSASIKTAGLAMEAFSPSLGGAASTILSKLLPALGLLGKGLLIYDAIKMVAQAWQLGNEKLAEYVALSEKAAQSGLTTDFYQRIAKGAEAAKTPIEALTKAFEKLTDAASPTLGGSTAFNRLDELTKAGNFGGNTGVASLQGANSNEERLRAVVSLTDQAMAKGERLAAIDLTKSFLGDEAAKNLAKDAGYLDKMVESADKIAAEDLVSSKDIQNAVELQNRLDAAEKILSQRWHPIQDLLTEAGIKMKEAWVGIVESIAGAVDWAAKLMGKLAEAPPWFQKQLDRGATAFMEMTTTPESRAAAEKQYGISSDKNDINALAQQQAEEAARQNKSLMEDAKRRLGEALNRKYDTSTAPGDKNAPDTSAYDRAEESLRKYIETTNAASKSVDEAAASQERLKAIAALTAAGMKDGLSREAAVAKAEMSGLATQAGLAAEALAKARVVSSIEFDRKTSFLSQEDVSIAQQLKGIYGNDVPAALNSTYAAGIRVNNAFKQISSAIEGSLTTGLADIVDGTKSVGQGFADMSKVIIRAIEEMIIKITIVQPLMTALQNSINGSGLMGFFGGGGGAINANGSIAGALGPTSIGGAPLVGLHAGGIVGAEATFSRYVHPAYFDNAPKFHTGGIAGDEVPIIAKRGEGVFTPGQMAALGGGSSGAVNVTVVNQTGVQADTETSKGPNGDITITLKKMVEGIVTDSMSKGSGARVLKNQYGIKPFTGQ